MIVIAPLAYSSQLLFFNNNDKNSNSTTLSATNTLSSTTANSTTSSRQATTAARSTSSTTEVDSLTSAMNNSAAERANMVPQGLTGGTTTTTTSAILSSSSSSITLASDNFSARSGFSEQDLSLINSTTNLQIQFIESLQKPSGAIIESSENPVVYTRDLSLAIVALILTGHMTQATLAINYLVSLAQHASNYTGPAGASFSSPYAWSQVYSVDGQTLDPSLRGEDQGMALFAISTYVLATHNFTFAKDHWPEIQNSANFILYLQHSPEPNIKSDGLYRHGDNWHDTRVENMNASEPIYWPYWPEYYQWEEENMRMINGLRGAITLAENLGMNSDAKTWNNSVNTAMVGLTDEGMYNKYEAYDYFGSVLWGIQTNLQAQKNILAEIPPSFFTPYGVKDLPWENSAAISDTIDYLVCLVRVGDHAGASHLLNVITSNYINPAGGFYDAIYDDGSPSSAPPQLYSSARFVYFDYVVSTLGG